MNENELSQLDNLDLSKLTVGDLRKFENSVLREAMIRALSRRDVAVQHQQHGSHGEHTTTATINTELEFNLGSEPE